MLPQNGQNCTLLVGLDDATILARITELLAVLDARQSALTGGSGDAQRNPPLSRSSTDPEKSGAIRGSLDSSQRGQPLASMPCAAQ